MLRKLLTLLAIITGLAAIQAPAHARISSIDDVRFEASAETGNQCSALVGGQLAEPKKRLEKDADEVKICRRVRVSIVVPTVYLGPDRAYE
jgi:hypothetical protein